MRPVYIHHVGLVSPLGASLMEAGRALRELRSGFTEMSGFPVAECVGDYKGKGLETYKGFHRLDRSTRLSLYAAHQLKGTLRSGRTAVSIGTSRGATGIWEEAHSYFTEHQRSRVLDSPLTTAGNMASHVGHYLENWDLMDLDQSITCASGLRAIADACAWLESGFVDQAVAGGAEAPLTPFTLSQMNALGLMPKGGGENPCRALDPDLSKNTMVLGEGAVLFHLSQNPDLTVEAAIVGVGFGSEPVTSATGLSPNGTCLQRSMKMAAEMAGWDRPDGIVAHAPGTVKGDGSERVAVKQLWGEIPMTTTKFLTGHCFGASGPMGVWMALEMMRSNEWITPLWVSGNSPEKLDKLIINAVGFGANAVSLAIAKNTGSNGNA